MSFTFDRFYPIVDSAAWVERLTRLGARLIQLRIKDQPPEVVRAEILTARDACERTGTLLIINDYWQLALDERCSFVHLGQGDLEAADISALRARGLGLGVSTHDHAELDRALALQPDYIALGPIYPTVLKKMPWEPQGLERIGEWRRLTGRIPLVAIGGLTVECLPAVFQAGADIAAVVTDIVRNANADERTREWLAATRAQASMSGSACASGDTTATGGAPAREAIR